MRHRGRDKPVNIPYPPARPGWLAQHVEPIIDPDIPVVDAHHHLFDRPSWRYRLEDYVDDLNSGHKVLATVYVECGAMYRDTGPAALRPVGETEAVAHTAALSESGDHGPTRVAAAIVGHADLTQGAAVQEVLQAHIKAGGSRFRGIRHATAWDADVHVTSRPRAPGLMSQPAFREGFACLVATGLSFDAWLYHPQLPELIALARDFPGTTIILDHLSGVLGIGPYAGRQDEVFAQWQKNLRELARLPHVHLKIGGLGMHMLPFGFHRRAQPPSSEDLATAWRPYVETAIEVFGANRCMFESNFPVDKAACSYPVLWNAFKRLVAGASEMEQAALLRETALRAYRIDAGTLA